MYYIYVIYYMTHNWIIIMIHIATLDIISFFLKKYNGCINLIESRSHSTFTPMGLKRTILIKNCWNNKKKLLTNDEICDRYKLQIKSCSFCWWNLWCLHHRKLPYRNVEMHKNVLNFLIIRTFRNAE